MSCSSAEGGADKVRCDALNQFRSRTSHPSFCYSVSDVVSLRPEEEMLWSYTGRVVAVMKDVQRRHHPTAQEPCDTMSKMGSNSSVITDHETPIPPRISCLDPGPALTRFIDLRPESDGKILVGRALSIVSASSATETAPSLTDISWCCFEVSSTLLANTPDIRPHRSPIVSAITTEGGWSPR
jgi:hypothetical protein